MLTILQKLFFTLLIIPNLSKAQCSISGIVTNKKGIPIPYVRIFSQDKNQQSFTNEEGYFRITTSMPNDTLTFYHESFISQKIFISKDTILKITLEASKFIATYKKSATTKIYTADLAYKLIGGESYNNTIENGFVSASSSNSFEVGIHSHKASYTNIRRFVEQKTEIPKEAVRIDEIINYIVSITDTIHYPSFQLYTILTSCPWDTKNILLHTRLNTPFISLHNIPPSNLVFLIDVSGSMDMPNRLPLLKMAMHNLVNHLRPIDTISIVTYGGNVSIQLNAISGIDKEKIYQAIDALEASGSTPGSFALQTAYQLATTHFIKKGNNRVILATDGDFNVGQTSEKSLEELIVKSKQTGIYLTCLGVGMGNLKDSKLEILANKGNGTYAYIDNEEEANKILWKNFAQTLYNVAHHAVLSIQFDSSMVQDYRLMGYDNTNNTKNDSSIVEGGQLSSNFSTDIIWEIRPKKNLSAAFKDSIWLEKPIVKALFQYWSPESHDMHTLKSETTNYCIPLPSADAYTKLYTATAMYASLLRQSKYIKNSRLKEVKKIIESTHLLDDYTVQSFYQLIIQTIKYQKKIFFNTTF